MTHYWIDTWIFKKKLKQK